MQTTDHRPHPRDPGMRHAVLESLGQVGAPRSCLSVSRDTGLSSLLVVPLLTRLVDEGVLSRVAGADGERWTYHLTPRGHRELRRRTPTGGARRGPRSPVAPPRAS